MKYRLSVVLLLAVLLLAAWGHVRAVRAAAPDARGGSPPLPSASAPPAPARSAERGLAPAAPAWTMGVAGLLALAALRGVRLP